MNIGKTTHNYYTRLFINMQDDIFTKSSAYNRDPAHKFYSRIIKFTGVEKRKIISKICK